jgi:predicted acylesterase/phospholipase RssA
MRVAYQAGVLAALEEAELRFHHVDGASGGTMNLSMLLGGQRSVEMCERWRTLDPKAFSALLPWWDYVRSPRWPSLGSARGLREKVFAHLGIDAELVRGAQGVVGTYNVANFSTKTCEVVEHRFIDDDLLVAAVSLPILMPAVQRNGAAYTDAVWIRDSNVPEAVRRGSDDIWLVWCIGNTPRYHRGLFRQYVHMIEMAASGSLRRDLDEVSARWPERPVRLHVIKPEHPIPLDPDYLLGRIDGAALIDLGYQDAQRYLDDPRPQVAPWGNELTAMREPSPGAAARLRLHGPFAFGASDPAEGARRGERAGTSVELHLRVTAAPAGETSAAGVEVAGDVSLPGRPHLLIGRAEASFAGPGLALTLSLPSEPSRWLRARPDGRAALAVLVHEGSPEGTVVGAGTAAFGWPEVRRTLPTIHATDSPGVVAGLRARASLAAAVIAAEIKHVAVAGGPPHAD